MTTNPPPGHCRLDQQAQDYFTVTMPNGGTQTFAIRDLHTCRDCGGNFVWTIPAPAGRDFATTLCNNCWEEQKDASGGINCHETSQTG